MPRRRSQGQPSTSLFYKFHSSVLDHLKAGNLLPQDVVVAAVIDGLDSSRRGGQYCTASNSYLAEKIGTTPRTVVRSIRKLEELRLISVRMNSTNNFRKIASKMAPANDEVPTEGGMTPMSPPMTPMSRGGDMHVIQVDKRVEGGGEDKAKELCRVEPSADPDRDSEAEAEAKAAEEKKRVTKIYRPLSMKLFEVISRVRRVVKTMSMTKWDREMKALVEHDGVPIGEVIVAIEQYGTIIGGEYVPEAWSAGNFREKFRKIQAAIARKGKKMGGRIVRPVMRADNVGKERRRIGG